MCDYRSAQYAWIMTDELQAAASLCFLIVVFNVNAMPFSSLEQLER